MCTDVLMVSKLALDKRFNDPLKRIKNRKILDKIIENIFIKYNHTSLMKKLRSSKIACGILNEIEDLELHSQLRKIVCKIDDTEIFYKFEINQNLFYQFTPRFSRVSTIKSESESNKNVQTILRSLTSCKLLTLNSSVTNIKDQPRS